MNLVGRINTLAKYFAPPNQMKALLRLIVCTAVTLSFPSLSQAKSDVFSSKPIWLPATEVTNGPKVAPFTLGFPQRVKTEHFSVANAGYWLGTKDQKPNQLAYFFQVNLDKPYASRVFTRVTLENPEDKSKPFIYESRIDPATGNTKVVHSPLNNVKLGQQYVFLLEVFSDEQRTVLLEKVTQLIQSPADNRSGCTVLPPQTMALFFPLEVEGQKTTLACTR